MMLGQVYLFNHDQQHSRTADVHIGSSSGQRVKATNGLSLHSSMCFVILEYNGFMVIQIPSDLEPKVRKLAQQKGVSPEDVVLAGVRQVLEQPVTLFDALQDVIGSVDGDRETPLDFADALLEKKRLGRL
jgi:hypothetical protein